MATCRRSVSERDVRARRGNVPAPDMRNPWLDEPEPVEPPEAAAPVEPRPATGPALPQRGVPVPDHVDRLRVIERNLTPALWVVGAHGGAGESSVAALDADWAAADHAWPLIPNGATRVVLTARTSAAGLRAAQNAATHWAAGLGAEVRLMGLVLIADAPGRLPRPLREYAQLVAGGVPRTWRLPWIEGWRLGEPPDPASSPREVRKLLEDLTTLTFGATGTTTRKEHP